MLSSSPDHRICSKGAPESIARMAAAQMSKAKAASKASIGNSRLKTQTHRRSRTGCYTCRLRRKKCDEGTPMCTACKHLGLQCEYKRPQWWSNNDERRQHKEDIKNVIKRKKLAEKSTSALHASAHDSTIASVSPPPGLSHSLPTSTTYSDATDRTRSASIDSHYSAGFNFNSPPHAHAHAHATELGSYRVLAAYSPYEVDVKTEPQMFVNDVPTLPESHVATFGTYKAAPPPCTLLPAGQPEGPGSVAGVDADAWTEHLGHLDVLDQDHDQNLDKEHEHECERKPSLAQETPNGNFFFDFAHGPLNPSRQVHTELEDGDQRLLDHFIHHVIPIIFPILESNQQASVGLDLILPALQSNSVYLHCCLSIAAQHLKTHTKPSPADIDGEIMKHRYATILSICEQLKRDENHQQSLEAALGLIFFQCVVGRFDDDLPDIAWHQHFQAAISLVQKLDLPRLVSNPAGQVGPTPFNMTLTGWIDILGATMRGTPPAFADTYRDKHLSNVNPHLGLRELMGCEDRVMYLISEIACLDWLKSNGMDDIALCNHARTLGNELTRNEVAELGEFADVDDVGHVWLKMPYSDDGTFSPKQLCRNITSAFRIAARIYLLSLIPGFSPSQDTTWGLIDKLTLVLQFIPSGAHGYDRSLVWVYLMAASVSLPGSTFRDFFEDRIVQLGDAAMCGAFGRMVTVVHEVWKQADILAQVNLPGLTVSEMGSKTVIEPMYPHVKWRDVMQANDWQFLLL
ncbi:hypothetical protein E4U21_004643 [Claviceps maximensis]|nr:hypothetical protein E4U21_004643 [Claviceps maximensis]